MHPIILGEKQLHELVKLSRLSLNERQVLHDLVDQARDLSVRVGSLECLLADCHRRKPERVTVFNE